jgi:hypothetical protein
MRHSDIFSPGEISNIENLKTLLKTVMQEKIPQIGSLENFLKNGILTGGCVSSLFHGEIPNDYDIYLKSTNSIILFKSLISEYTDSIAEYVDKYSEHKVGDKIITNWAVTFKNGIQVIVHDTVDVRRPQFDFIHCMPWYDIEKDLFYISREQYDCIRDKKLVKNPKYTMHLSNKRISKYNDRGWRFKEIG